MTSQSDTVAIGALVTRINQAWTEADAAALRACFHPQMVIVAPGFAARLEGRDACVASYLDFVRQARIQGYSHEAPSIELWGDTAVACYRFAIAWEAEGQAHYEAGRDLIVFRRDEGQWQAVWRTVIPAGETGPAPQPA